jgi:hypothetical protein
LFAAALSLVARPELAFTAVLPGHDPQPMNFTSAAVAIFIRA